MYYTPPLPPNPRTLNNCTDRKQCKSFTRQTKKNPRRVEINGVHRRLRILYLLIDGDSFGRHGKCGDDSRGNESTCSPPN